MLMQLKKAIITLKNKSYLSDKTAKLGIFLKSHALGSSLTAKGKKDHRRQTSKYWDWGKYGEGKEHLMIESIQQYQSITMKQSDPQTNSNWSQLQ